MRRPATPPTCKSVRVAPGTRVCWWKPCCRCSRPSSIARKWAIGCGRTSVPASHGRWRHSISWPGGAWKLMTRTWFVCPLLRSVSNRLTPLISKIQFVGMSVYKEEASASVDMDQIYIPLRVVPEGAVKVDAQGTRADPASLLTSGTCHVILGDPGSGKSTLLRFLALAGSQPQLIKRYGTQKDDRLPVLVTLRRYADELKSR